MSWHCLICGCPEVWMRNKERPKDSQMVEMKVYEECSTTKVMEAVCHADCLRLVLKNGQEKYMHKDVDGYWDFKELKKASKRKRL